MVDVSLRRIDPAPIAVARREVRPSELATVMSPSIEAVRAFVRARGIDAGRSVVVHGTDTDGEQRVWLGVEVAVPFDGDCTVDCASLPIGLTAVATHVGGADGFDAIGITRRAVVEWCEARGHALSGTSWERHAVPSDDAHTPETDVGYLLA